MTELTVDDALRAQADTIARQGVLRDMPTAGWATMTASCPHCGVEVQTALEPARPYTALEMTPMALAVHVLRHSLFGHLRAYHPEIALALQSAGGHRG
jgi:hypothetical protein